MKVTIVRVEESKEGTFGVLLINNKATCVTLEPADYGNQPNISNIPPGVYLCKKTKCQSYGETIHVTDVPGRTGILFHPGNTTENTKGCILVGQFFGKLRDKRAIMNSGFTFKGLMSDLDDCFALEIKEIL